MNIREFQKQIEKTFGEKDRARSLESTWMWFTEEVGELARALNGRTSRENLKDEFADVFAWLVTMASIADVDLEEVSKARYGQGCPRCDATPCVCDEARQRPLA